MSIIFLKFRAGFPDSVSGRDATFINMYKKKQSLLKRVKFYESFIELCHARKRLMIECRKFTFCAKISIEI